MADEISVKQSPKQMAVGEAIAWTFQYPAAMGTPSSITSFMAYDETMTDKSSVVLSGSASISDDTIIGKLFTPASAQEYTLVCTAVFSGNTIISTLLCEVYSPITAITLSNGYATIKELKHYLAPGATQDKYDDEIMAHLIEAASRYIDGDTRRTFYARSSTRYYSVPDDRWLWLDDDLLTITTLTNGDGTVITSGYYYLYPKNNPPYTAIVLKQSSSYVWESESDGDSEYVITVAGTWGNNATGSQPASIKQACLQLAGALYKRRFGENLSAATTITPGGIVVTPQDVPVFVQNVLNFYRRLI